MSISLPVLSEAGLSQYLRDIQKFPMLTAEEEYMLASRWQQHGDVEAAHTLVTSHLKLVAKIASNYRGYGLPQMDLIAEGNIGLMQAVKRFDPDKGFRLSTYAIWWIKASIQEYVLHSWSLVKIGTTAAQKKLFFNLRKIRNRITRADTNSLTDEDIGEIANELAVSRKDVVDMEQRLQSDMSLNAPMIGHEDASGEHIDFLPSTEINQEVQLADTQDYAYKKEKFTEALSQLNDRERDIIARRRLQDSPSTLEELSQHYGVSRERIRQIEERAVEKMQDYIQQLVTSH